LLVAAALAVAPGAAWAADTKAASPAKSAAAAAAAPTGTDDERAAKWLSEGNKAFKDGKFAEAEKAYKEAFALKKVYDIAGNLAMAEFAQSKHRDAAEHLALAIRLFPVTGEPATREQMQKTFDQCKGHVGTVKVEIATVRGAQVSVDGKVFGEAPLADDLFLDPGQHTISVTAKGYKDASKSVDVQKGVASVVKLELVLLPPEVVVKNGPEPLPPPPPRSKVPAIVLGGVAVIAAGVGGALLGVAGGKASDANTQAEGLKGARCVAPPGTNTNEGCTKLVDTAKSADSLHNAGIGLFIGAGVAGVAAVTYLLLPPRAAKKASSTGVRATPLVGPDGAALLVSGSF
jgi:PEGA domain-containing protein